MFHSSRSGVQGCCCSCMEWSCEICSSATQPLTDFLSGNRSEGLLKADWSTPAQRHVSPSAPSRYPLESDRQEDRHKHRDTETKTEEETH